MNKFLHTAILVFSRFAEEESKEKKLGQYVGKKKGIELAEGLIGFTIHEAVSTGLPVFKFFSDKQQGSSFGERLANSIETLFAQGFLNLIVIGTDCPSISSEILLTTNIRLQQHDLVIGPASDGGVYLIGISKEGYQRDSFLSLPWLTPAVYDSFRRYALNLHLSLFTEPVEQDIDHWSSLITWAKSNFQHAVSALLNNILTSFLFRKTSYLVIKTFTSAHLSIDPFRGPPSSLVC